MHIYFHILFETIFNKIAKNLLLIWDQLLCYGYWLMQLSLFIAIIINRGTFLDLIFLK